MFGNIKPTASLSSGLLARKGQARPAMRPQGFLGQPLGDDFAGAMNLDDLGWNDMGEDPAPVVSIAPAAIPVAEPIAPPIVTVPPVLVEREALHEAITPEPVEDSIAPVSTATARRIAREVSAKTAKAAFTLRLDPDRHLRLRLASATRNRSSQAIVIQALDAFIASLPEVDGLVEQLSTKVQGKK